MEPETLSLEMSLNNNESVMIPSFSPSAGFTLPEIVAPNFDARHIISMIESQVKFFRNSEEISFKEKREREKKKKKKKKK